MNSYINLWGRIINCICFALSLISISVNAVTITGEYDGKSIRWDTALSYNTTYLTSSTYDIFSYLTPTNRWIPLATPKTVTMTLKNGTNTVSTSVHIAGLEYNFGGTNFDFVDNSQLNPSISVTECKNTAASGKTIAMYSPTSGECVGNKHLSNSVGQQTPFFFVRPIFSLDESQLEAALSLLPVGNYVSEAVTLSFRYFYYSGSGIRTYRNLTIPFALQINSVEYDAIESVTVENLVSGGLNGVIEPIYDKASQTVTGRETEYLVTVNGSFATGINMTFKPGVVSDGYILKHENYATNSGAIKYDIKCDDKCNVQNIVTNGLAINVNNVAVPISKQSTSEQLVYKIKVGYSTSQPFDDVYTGRYSGSFIIEFGLGI